MDLGFTRIDDVQAGYRTGAGRNVPEADPRDVREFLQRERGFLRRGRLYFPLARRYEQFNGGEGQRGVQSVQRSPMVKRAQILGGGSRLSGGWEHPPSFGGGEMCMNPLPTAFSLSTMVAGRARGARTATAGGSWCAVSSKRSSHLLAVGGQY